MGGSRTWSARSVPDCTRRRKTPRYLVLSNGCSRSIPPAVMLYLSQYTMGSLVPSFRGVVIAVCRCPSVWGWPPSPHRVQADHTTSTAHGKQQQPASPMQICSDFREYQTDCDPFTQPQPTRPLSAATATQTQPTQFPTATSNTATAYAQASRQAAHTLTRHRWMHTLAITQQLLREAQSCWSHHLRRTYSETGNSEEQHCQHAVRHRQARLTAAATTSHGNRCRRQAHPACWYASRQQRKEHRTVQWAWHAVVMSGRPDACVTALAACGNGTLGKTEFIGSSVPAAGLKARTSQVRTTRHG